MSRAVFAVGAILIAVGLAAPPARSGTATDHLAVTATVLSACSLSGGTLSFGTYTSGQTTNLDVNGIINYVNCSGSLSFALDGGGSGNINARQMQLGHQPAQLSDLSQRSPQRRSGAPGPTRTVWCCSPPSPAPSRSMAASRPARRCRTAPTPTPSTSR